MTQEENRMQQQYEQGVNWLQWGPYLSERQWGTVREDYSSNGEVWNFMTHDMARSKAYRWGEDGLAGFCDDKQIVCVSLALWNGKDPILKERLFGLNNYEGNHGEDVKELYYYLDNTPTHSYQKMLYKYPQGEFPYKLLVEENARRSRNDPEFELDDTGIFDERRYFDVFVESAKAAPDDILIRYHIYNRGDRSALIHVLPQLFFRNTWSYDSEVQQPLITYTGKGTLLLQSPALGNYHCYVDGEPQFLFTNNETNSARLQDPKDCGQFVKDAFHRLVVEGDTAAVNPVEEGTKAAAWFHFDIPAGGDVQVRVRIRQAKTNDPFSKFDKVFDARKREADLFYEGKLSKTRSEDERLMQRQAWAGMLWSKQFYNYNINQWRDGNAGEAEPSPGRKTGRNSQWRHFIADDIISMPDKWEYPWFAAWDLAFHAMALAPLDPDLAKSQLTLLLRANFMHPNGQLPAYEWDFGDANPPVHALSAWKVFLVDKKIKGKPDHEFLETVFQKLVINFTWWVNRKDSNGNNIFEGGFLGLDNIGVFNRNAPVPGGGHLEQADGTSWMAVYALNMVQIALELSLKFPVYENMAVKFSEHFFYIAGSITTMGEDSEGLWDDTDGFYYDLLRLQDCSWDRLRIRSMVGLIPMFAAIVFDDNTWKNLPSVKLQLDKFSQNRPDLANLVSRWRDLKGNEQHLFSLLRGHRLKLLLRRMLDSQEFLSDYGIRSLSKIYEKNPYNYWLNNVDYSVKFTPAESDIDMFGGNSNWRGPVWMPLNYLIIDALYNFHAYYTDDFRVEYPTGSGEYASLADIASSLGHRLHRIFLKDENGNRPVFGGKKLFNDDPHFRDYILFYEYFHADNGTGLGASHQTGWTGLIAILDMLSPMPIQ